MRHYYAAEHHYGAGVCDEDGRAIATVIAFTSQADRDAWVDAGPDYTTEPGYREAWTAAEVRSRANTRYVEPYAELCGTCSTLFTAFRALKEHDPDRCHRRWLRSLESEPVNA